MKQSKNIKIVVGALVLALLAFVGYKYLNTGDAASDSDVLIAQNQNQDVVGSDIIAELRLLNSIQLDVTIFTSDVFRSLNDFSLEVVPEPQGRVNPFASIGSDSVASAASTSTTQR